MRRIENIEVAWIMSEIADLLELQGESIFKIRAYQKAAKAIATLAADLSEMSLQGKLETVPGIGKAISGKIGELFKTGKIEYYENLKAEVPPGLLEVVTVPGIGARMAQQLYRKLGVSSLDELEAAARGKKIRGLPGMGNKTEMNILRGIEMLRSGIGQVTLGIADAMAEALTGFLKSLPGVAEAGAAGSVRRMKDAIGDIDLVVGSYEAERVIDIFVKHPQVKKVLAKGDTKARVVTLAGIGIDLLVVEPEQYWTAMHHFTGSKEHNVRLREIAHKKGLKINEYGIFGRDDDIQLPAAGEADIYAHLGMAYIPPELREDLGEVEAALNGTLPDLVETGDIKGDLHLHSDWSDGVNSIEEIVGRAAEMGYEYIAITDHSRSLGIARGLSVERLGEQERYLRALNEKTAGIEILSGIEADILSNGDLDYPDEILAARDIVVASVHSGFRQDREKITGRVISAMKNSHVDIVAHPTGRLIGRREPYAIDMEEVFAAAVKYGTALEINASPDRLDLSDRYVRRAAELGIRISINTDAHDINRMDEMKYGVATARRGWLEKKDVLNTMGKEELLDYLSRDSSG
ncbi:DNA polymerase/3'-5' exonuclease PolX [Phosphitispora fastidiosa]|uniref:DNA polymerase/3'-5' exonuclease PolX n=1 Tax=Phosphitispora fastidiosa TaxID=2837202 RepID=UPI001E47AC67|nr:DNA polymerase/3'-5' exonuclease PolX [Phosphitispora fastidiosa]MBU7007248.1 DNA polymerase (family 10) [Phosphitispora fastidiosa]